MAFFHLVLQTSGTLHPHGEPDDFVSVYTGVIQCLRERDNRVVNVGKVKAYRVHAYLARQAGESVLDVCDAHSQGLHEVYAALFDPAEDDLKAAIRGRFDAMDSDVLVLDYVLLSPRWRGLKLGLLATRKLIDLLGGGCGLAVSYIAPLNPDADEFRMVPQGWIPRQETEAEEKASKKRLRRYFRQLGFRRVGRTRFFGMSLAQVVPTLADLIRPVPG
jgi:hypothetical protein